MKYKRLVSGLGCLVGLVVGAVPVLGWQPLPVAQDQKLFLPGSQPGSVVVPASSTCTNCHAGYDPVAEPFHAWQGSMMAQATRDPLWLATLAVAAQDSIWALGNPNATDLCLRCHTPTGWLGGRSDPTNGTALDAKKGDFEGVSCASCHLMIDPFTALGQQPEVPAETDPVKISAASATQSIDSAVLSALKLFDNSPFYDPVTKLPLHYGPLGAGDLARYIEGGAGQMFLDPNTKNRRGPRTDVSTRSHDFQYSRFHRSRAMCHTCHDVSNSVLANVLIGQGTPETSSAASYFHVERTSSEFELSDYAVPGGAPTGAPMAAAGVAHAAACQDCHMPRVPGGFAKQGNLNRPDVASHQLSGGNSWMTGILASLDATGPAPDAYNRAILDGTKYPGAQLETAGLQGAGAALAAGRQRALDMLRRAATVETVEDFAGQARLRVVNHTGHKLISGFPEGRRMWLNVRFVDASGATVGEINPYLPLEVATNAQGNKVYLGGGDLAITRDDLVFEANMSSSLTGEAKTFHFVLATDRYKDNRIPPRGFRIGEAAARIAQPRWQGADAPGFFTAAEYAGGYDEVVIDKPAGAKGWVATLFYQTTSKAYVEFLRDEIKGSGGTLPEPAPSGESPAYRIQSDAFFTSLKGWGDAIWDLWLHNGGSAPVAMAAGFSLPEVVGLAGPPGQFTVRVQTLPGRFYQLEASTGLAADGWAVAGPVVAGDGSVVSLTASAPPGQPREFYRVRSWLE
jgi:hypothetical protein